MIIPLWPLSIKLDVLIVQIINVLILLYMFKKLFWKALVEEIQQRKALTKKLQNADAEYDALITKANAEKEEIIATAMAHKQHVMQEAMLVAEETKKNAIAKAEMQAQEIIEKAQKDTNTAREELLDHYESWIKQTAMQVVQKIFHNNTDVQEKYIDILVKEIVTTNKS